MKLKGEIDPHIALDLSNKATLAFLQRHLSELFTFLGLCATDHFLFFYFYFFYLHLKGLWPASFNTFVQQG